MFRLIQIIIGEGLRPAVFMKCQLHVSSLSITMSLSGHDGGDNKLTEALSSLCTFYQRPINTRAFDFYMICRSRHFWPGTIRVWDLETTYF
jgi:hypothetical protein